MQELTYTPLSDTSPLDDWDYQIQACTSQNLSFFSQIQTINSQRNEALTIALQELQDVRMQKETEMIKNVSLQNDISTLRQKVEQLENDNVLQKTKNEQSNQLVEQLTNQLQDLKRKCLLMEIQCSSFNQIKEEHKGSIDSLNNQIANLKDIIDERELLTSIVNAKASQQESAKQKVIDELQKTIAQCEMKLRQSQDERSKINEKLLEHIQLQEQLSSKVLVLQNEYELLKQVNETELALKETDLEDLKQKIEQTQKQAHYWRQTSDRQREKFNESNDKFLSLEDKVQQLQNPKTYKDRCILLMSWFNDKRFEIKQKVLFMNWAQNFFQLVSLNRQTETQID